MNEPFKSVLQHLTKTGELPVTPKPPVDLTSNDPRLNLDRLQRYLEALPADYAEFDMREFVKRANLEQLVIYGKQNGSVASCGTAACAVGHGPAAHMFMSDEEIKLVEQDQDDEAWFSYTKRVFGAPIGSPAFEWMFGGGWSHSDNSVHGAAKRIRYFLREGIPRGFQYAHHMWLESYADA